MSTFVQGIDPRTAEPVGSVPETSPEELAGLLAAAADAAPWFAATEPSIRIELLTGLADALDRAVDEVVPIAMAETGLPRERVAGEVARSSGQLRLFADVVRDGAYLGVVLDSPATDAVPPRPDLRRWLEPLGPVLVFAASNFPFAFSILGGDTASALAAGCPVLVKAHGSHPATSAAVAAVAARVVHELGLPDGIFGIVFGDDQGLTALRHENIKAAGFTGSTEGGTFLADVAAKRRHPIPFFGEMGSVNPAVVTRAAADARGTDIAKGFVASMTLGTGQFCTKPGLLFLPAGHGMERALVAEVEAVPPAPMLNARIRAQRDRGLRELEEHAEVIARSTTAAPDVGFWASATLFRTSAATLLTSPDAIAEEYFGPNAVVVEYADETELLAALRAIDGTLTASLHAERDDPAPVKAVLDELRGRAGRVIVNGWPTGVAVTWSMQHGGPWPATTNAATTSVGAAAIGRWLRPVCYQDVPADLLPPALRDDNPWHLPRRIDGLSATG